MPRPYRDGYEPFPPAVRKAALHAAAGWEICNTGKYAAYTDDELAEIIGDAEVTILK